MERTSIVASVGLILTILEKFKLNCDKQFSKMVNKTKSLKLTI